MSTWNGNYTSPNWSGTTTLNSQKLVVSSIQANNISTGVLTVGNAFISSINNSTIDSLASNWSHYPFTSTVWGIPSTVIIPESGILCPQYNFSSIHTVYAANLEANVYRTDVVNPLAVAGGNITAQGLLKAPIGDIYEINAETINVGDSETSLGDLNVYGLNHIVGDNALYVEGGVTLTGGDTHGTTIGCLTVGGINTTRLDILPIGIDMLSATYLSMTAAIAGNLTVGTALTLDAGIYVEINTPTISCVNTLPGDCKLQIDNIEPSENPIGQLSSFKILDCPIAYITGISTASISAIDPREGIHIKDDVNMSYQTIYNADDIDSYALHTYYIGLPLAETRTKVGFTQSIDLQGSNSISSISTIYTNEAFVSTILVDTVASKAGVNGFIYVNNPIEMNNHNVENARLMSMAYLQAKVGRDVITVGSDITMSNNNMYDIKNLSSVSTFYNDTAHISSLNIGSITAEGLYDPIYVNTRFEMNDHNVLNARVMSMAYLQAKLGRDVITVGNHISMSNNNMYDITNLSSVSTFYNDVAYISTLNVDTISTGNIQYLIPSTLQVSTLIAYNISTNFLNTFGNTHDNVPTVSFNVPVDDERADFPFSTIALTGSAENILSNSGTFTTYSNVTINNGEKETATLVFDSNITLTASPTTGYGQLQINGDVIVDCNVTATTYYGTNVSLTNQINVPNTYTNNLTSSNSIGTNYLTATSQVTTASISPVGTDIVVYGTLDMGNRSIIHINDLYPTVPLLIGKPILRIHGDIYGSGCNIGEVDTVSIRALNTTDIGGAATLNITSSGNFNNNNVTNIGILSNVNTAYIDTLNVNTISTGGILKLLPSTINVSTLIANNISTNYISTGIANVKALSNLSSISFSQGAQLYTGVDDELYMPCESLTIPTLLNVPYIAGVNGSGLTIQANMNMSGNVISNTNRVITSNINVNTISNIAGTYVSYTTNLYMSGSNILGIKDTQTQTITGNNASDSAVWLTTDMNMCNHSITNTNKIAASNISTFYLSTSVGVVKSLLTSGINSLPGDPYIMYYNNIYMAGSNITGVSNLQVQTITGNNSLDSAVWITTAMNMCNHNITNASNVTASNYYTTGRVYTNNIGAYSDVNVSFYNDIYMMGSNIKGAKTVYTEILSSISTVCTVANIGDLFVGNIRGAADIFIYRSLFFQPNVDIYGVTTVKTVNLDGYGTALAVKTNMDLGRSNITNVSSISLNSGTAGKLSISSDGQTLKLNGSNVGGGGGGWTPIATSDLDMRNYSILSTNKIIASNISTSYVSTTTLYTHYIDGAGLRVLQDMSFDNNNINDINTVTADAGHISEIHTADLYVNYLHSGVAGGTITLNNNMNFDGNSVSNIDVLQADNANITTLSNATFYGKIVNILDPIGTGKGIQILSDTHGNIYATLNQSDTSLIIANCNGVSGKIKLDYSGIGDGSISINGSGVLELSNDNSQSTVLAGGVTLYNTATSEATNLIAANTYNYKQLNTYPALIVNQEIQANDTINIIGSNMNPVLQFQDPYSDPPRFWTIEARVETIGGIDDSKVFALNGATIDLEGGSFVNINTAYMYQLASQIDHIDVISPLNMLNNYISNASVVNTATLSGVSDVIGVLASLNMCNYNISNVNTITSADATSLTLKPSLSQPSGGQVVITNADGTSGQICIAHEAVLATSYLRMNANNYLELLCLDGIELLTGTTGSAVRIGNGNASSTPQTGILEIFYGGHNTAALYISDDSNFTMSNGYGKNVVIRNNLDMCNFNLSNVNYINGSAYPPASAWNGTATSYLNMNTLPISNATRLELIYPSGSTHTSLTNEINAYSIINAASNVNTLFITSNVAVESQVMIEALGTTPPALGYHLLNGNYISIIGKSGGTIGNNFAVSAPLDMCNQNLYGVNTINTSLLNVVTLSNNNPATPILARIGINMCNNDLTNCGNIELKAQKGIVGLSNMRFDTGLTANTPCQIYTSTIGTLATTITSQLVFSNTSLTDSPCVFATGIDMGTNGKIINVTQINGASYPPASVWNGNATSNLVMNNNSITTVNTITGSNLNTSNVTTSNIGALSGQTTVNMKGHLNMGNSNLSNVGMINGAAYPPPLTWDSNATSGLDMNGYNIDEVNNLTSSNQYTRIGSSNYRQPFIQFGSVTIGGGPYEVMYPIDLTITGYHSYINNDYAISLVANWDSSTYDSVKPALTTLYKLSNGFKIISPIHTNSYTIYWTTTGYVS